MPIITISRGSLYERAHGQQLEFFHFLLCQMA